MRLFTWRDMVLLASQPAHQRSEKAVIELAKLAVFFDGQISSGAYDPEDHGPGGTSLPDADEAARLCSPFAGKWDAA